MKQTKTAALVVGEGWAALGAAAFLLHSGKNVLWFSGTGSRLIAPVPALEAGKGVAVWRDLLSRFEIEAGDVRTGSFLREFRNKAFREPTWTKAPTPDARIEVRDEILWAPEARFAGSIEARFDLSLAELEETLRARVLAHPKLTRLEGEEVHAIHAAESGEIEVTLGSGDRIVAERAIYADRWSSLLTVQGLPKPLPFLRHRKPVGALQAMFTHDPAVGQGVEEGFFGASHKDSGDEFTRNVWGHFFCEGRKSVWTLFIEAEEAEDNHEVTKKLRRLKQACERMFGSPEWIGEGKKDFMSTVAAEQFRFEEGVVYGGGEPPSTPVRLPGFKGLVFMTDAYGPARALEQVAQALGEELGIETELRVRDEVESPSDPVPSAQVRSDPGDAMRESAEPSTPRDPEASSVS